MPYNAKHVKNFNKVKHDRASGTARFQVLPTEKSYTRMNELKYHDDMLRALIISTKESQLHQTKFVSKEHRVLQGLDSDIDHDRSPKNFADTMSRTDKQLWEEAFN